jgi:carbamoyl-phosphate synthase large subunit
MKLINILFLGGGKRVSLAERFISAGLKLGIKINTFSYELEKKVPFLLVGKVIIGKTWLDKTIYDDLIQIIDERKITIIIANVDYATLVLAELNSKYPNLGLISSDAITCKIFLDKLKMQNHCDELSIKIIPLSANKFPMFLKPRMGSASKGIYRVNDEQYLNYLLKQIEESNYVKQKYIEGIEYTVDAYVSKNGKFVGAVPRIRHNVTAGESTTSIIIYDKEILNFTKEILGKFNLRGPITLQFIRTKKDLYFLEINPRFGGGVIASIEAGFDIPKIMIQDYLDVQLSNKYKIKPVIMTRCYREAFHAINN